ncbi:MULTISPECIES: type VII secretion-associated serine protease mycosin [Streptomycetaceae]|uniref:type VII secretion-associated serine protease mycosin n=1 Tax=Streptomycetaceae TaxID=2062 RepID=UPI001E4F1B7B|nr:MULTISPECIES: type VII secretion-associated serine protease mycosin [Streptomycetaceae]
MQADAMWKVSTGQGVTVAVVDTGSDGKVTELVGQVLPGKDYTSPTGNGWNDTDGHGTSMAMLIAGTGDDGGIVGLAPGAKILPLRVLAGGGPNRPGRDLKRVADAIHYAADHGAKVINIAIGVPDLSSSPEDRAPLGPAVQYALKRGSLVFAATGNDAQSGNPLSYPAATPGAVGVGAVDKTGTVGKFSTYGPQVALVAPGVDVPGHCSKSLAHYGDGYCIGYGTSEATALASASAALVWAKHPDWTNNQVLRVLINTAGKPKTGKIPSEYIGYGTVRPRVALLDGAGDPGPADVNPLFPNLGSPSPSTAPAGKSSGKPTQAGAARGGGAGDTGAWMWAGIAAAVVVVGGGLGAAVLRRRRAH